MSLYSREELSGECYAILLSLSMRIRTCKDWNDRWLGPARRMCTHFQCCLRIRIMSWNWWCWDEILLLWDALPCELQYASSSSLSGTTIHNHMSTERPRHGRARCITWSSSTVLCKMRGAEDLSGLSTTAHDDTVTILILMVVWCLEMLLRGLWGQGQRGIL